MTSKRVRTRGLSTQSRRSNSAANSNSRGPKAGSRRASDGGQWSGQHAQSQFRPLSDVEDSDSDLTSVSADTVSHDRASSPELGEGAINDTTIERPRTGDSGQPKNRSPDMQTHTQKAALEGSPDLGLEASETRRPALNGTDALDALDGLATAAVVLAAQNSMSSTVPINRSHPTELTGPASYDMAPNGVHPLSRSTTPHTRQSSRSDYQSAPASPLLATDNQPPRFPPQGQTQPASKMRLENFLRPGPPPPVERSNTGSPTKSIAEFHQKTHDFGAPIGRRPGPLSSADKGKVMPAGPGPQGPADPRDPRTIVAAPVGRESLNGHFGGIYAAQPTMDHGQHYGAYRGPGPDAWNGARAGGVQGPPPSPRSSSSFVNRMVN